ncbi:cyclophilin-like fold protein [Dactylosporangium sp. NPDC050588]|uniref:cyclophilin-like fold protein n=1 Tax=Dactylosporangium sp. NPDC050588 TaxID=3157211 RepID=UPI0033C2F030
MFTARTTVRVALSAVAGLTLAACGGNGQAGATGDPTSTTTPSATSPATAAPSDTAAPSGEQMKIQITINGKRMQATIFDSAAGRDLLAQLPLTIDMTDHGAVEKTGPLPSPLSLDGQPEGADPDVGAVGYYAPGNDFVLYYGDQSYFPGIVVIGRLDGDAASRIAAMDGAVTATVEPA